MKYPQVLGLLALTLALNTSFAGSGGSSSHAIEGGSSSHARDKAELEGGSSSHGLEGGSSSHGLEGGSSSHGLEGSGGSSSHGGWGVREVTQTENGETYFLDDYAAFDRLGNSYLARTAYESENEALVEFVRKTAALGLSLNEQKLLMDELVKMQKLIQHAPSMTPKTAKSLPRDFIPYRATRGNYMLGNASVQFVPVIAFRDAPRVGAEVNWVQWLRIKRPTGRVSAYFHEWFSHHGRNSGKQSVYTTADARDLWITIHDIGSLALQAQRSKAAEAIRSRLARKISER